MTALLENECSIRVYFHNSQIYVAKFLGGFSVTPPTKVELLQLPLPPIYPPLTYN